MDAFGAKEKVVAETSSKKRKKIRGSQPQQERRPNEILEEEIEEWEKEKSSEIKSSKGELSELLPRVHKLESQMSKMTEAMKARKVTESWLQQMQEQILNQPGQEHDVVPMECDYPDSSVLKHGFLFCEETSNDEAKLSPDNVNVEGFTVAKEIFLSFKKILDRYPNIDSMNGFMNTLAKVFKIAETEKVTQDEIKQMEEGVQGLESCLKDLVVERRNDFKRAEKIRSTEAKLNRLKERENKREEDRKSKRQKPDVEK